MEAIGRLANFGQELMSNIGPTLGEYLGPSSAEAATTVQPETAALIKKYGLSLPTAGLASGMVSAPPAGSAPGRLPGTFPSLNTFGRGADTSIMHDLPGGPDPLKYIQTRSDLMQWYNSAGTPELKQDILDFVSRHYLGQ